VSVHQNDRESAGAGAGAAIYPGTRAIDAPRGAHDGEDIAIDDTVVEA